MIEEQSPDPVAERVARNDAAFRDANEHIQSSAAAMGLDEAGFLPVICECADVTCSVILQLTHAEYEEVRRHPERFLNARDHVRSALGWARVVSEHDRYTVVEKLGDAAEIAVELDPRGPEDR
jgi:hypothetical protein